MRRLCRLVTSVSLGLAVSSAPTLAQSADIYHRGGGRRHAGSGHGAIGGGPSDTAVPRETGCILRAPQYLGAATRQRAFIRKVVAMGTAALLHSVGGHEYVYPQYGGYPGYAGGNLWSYPLAVGIGSALASALADEDAYYYPDDMDGPYGLPLGGYCRTAHLTCQLYNSGPLGTGCSCRVPAGRARGIVTN